MRPVPSPVMLTLGAPRRLVRRGIARLHRRAHEDGIQRPAPVAGTELEGSDAAPGRESILRGCVVVVPECVPVVPIEPALPLPWVPVVCMPSRLVPMWVLAAGVELLLGTGDAVPGGTRPLLGGVAAVSFGVVEGVVGAVLCALTAPAAHRAAMAKAVLRLRSFMR